jgi:hypothetical protein
MTSPCSPAAFLFLLLSSAPVLAQSVVFEERFDGGMPAGWTNIHVSGNDIWTPGYAQVNGTPDMYHEWWCDNGFSWRDNNLVSPPVDLSGLTNVTFYCEQHQQFPGAIDYNAIEVSTDGGQSFTVLQQVTAPPDGFSVIQVSMAAYAGLPSVQIGLHYRGFAANGWSIDNVRILTTNPLLSVQNLVAGSTATLFVRGAEPGNTVHLGISSAGAGPTVTPFGTLNLTQPIRRIAVRTADANGDVTLNLPVPAGLTGRTLYLQAVEIWAGGGGEPSNSLVEVVQ